jgi:hypothetical protein
VNLSAGDSGNVPPGVVTVTSISPAGPAGEVAVIEVALLTVKEVASVLPNFTPVTPIKLVPVITTLLPPATQDFGEIPVTVGGPGFTRMGPDIPLMRWDPVSVALTCRFSREEKG